MHYSENLVIDFLHELYEDGHSYSSINTARSALSAWFVCSNGETIGSSPLIKRFMKGVFECQAPKPKYIKTWDVNIVLNFLREIFPYDQFGLYELTHKLACLVALVTAQRAQTLSVLSTKDLVLEEDKCIIMLNDHIKTSTAKNKIDKIEIPKYSDVKLCPVVLLEEYLRRTELLRLNESTLFISYNKPHKSVTASTIGRWIKDTLYEAGIDTEYFGAHSTRSAATSAADRNGVNIQHIMKTAGWRNAGTFTTFYKKPVQGYGFNEKELGILTNISSEYSKVSVHT